MIALLLVFFLPGFALTKAMFSRNSLSMPARLLMYVGLSVTVVAIGGLVLNWVYGGLQSITWVILLVVIIMGAFIVSSLQRRRQRKTGLDNWLDFRTIVGDVNTTQMLLLGFALLVVIGAWWIAKAGAGQINTTSFTQLWILPNDNSIPESIRLGVHNMESSEIKFKLLLRTGDGSVFESFLFEIKPGEKWETIVRIPNQQSDIGLIEADLFRLDAPETIYRRVTLVRDK